MLLAVAALVIVILFFINQKKNKEIKQLKSKIDKDLQLTRDVRRRLLELVEINKEIDSEVASELTNISALLEIKQDTKALSSLAKIIEKLLKQLYKYDTNFHLRYKRATFADYLEYAKEKGVISSEDFHLISVLRLIRNEEAHELNVQKEQSKITAAFVTGIAFVLTLTKMLRKNVGIVA